MFSPKTPSVQGYTMAKIIVTDFGWNQSFPMPCQSKASEVPGLLFMWEGDPPKMIIDDAKEMKLGEFARKCKKASCHLPSTEPYSPRSNLTKHEIRELKKSVTKRLTWSGMPRRL